MQSDQPLIVWKLEAEEQSGSFFIHASVDRDYFPPHKHDYIEIQYIMNGSGIHYINGQPYEVQRGSMLFLNYGDIHAQRPETPMEIITCHMTPSFFSEELINSENAMDLFNLSWFREFKGVAPGIPPVITFEGKQMVKVESLINLMMEEYKEKQKGYMTAIKGYMNAMYTQMLRISSSTCANEFPYVVNIVLQYIETNYNQKLHLAELAKRCFYNTNYLSRMFKECYRESISSYIQRFRIEKAAQMLLTTQDTIESICTQVGYNDKKQFYKIFKLHFCTTPAQYRHKQATNTVS
jgi:AraC-like DNA-binding protein/mannose-6-phosphate isomerase-like protein (cupin superfamily)